MKFREIAIPAILTIVACRIGFAVSSGPVSANCPADQTGRTSIIIHIEGEGWCELRGPARWKVLDDCTGPPIVPNKRAVQAKADCEGLVDNPYCAVSAGGVAR